MEQTHESRRSFLKQLLAGSAVVATATLTGTKAGTAQQNHAKEADEVLYRETKAFRKYYQSLR